MMFFCSLPLSLPISPPARHRVPTHTFLAAGFLAALGATFLTTFLAACAGAREAREKRGSER